MAKRIPNNTRITDDNRTDVIVDVLSDIVIKDIHNIDGIIVDVDDTIKIRQNFTKIGKIAEQYSSQKELEDGKEIHISV